MQITRDKSINLKAVAIFFVLISHLVPPFLPFHEFYIPAKRFIGQLGVNIFMFISGYGICLTYITGEISSRQFLARRFLKLSPLYIATLLSTYLFQVFIFNKDISLTTLIIHLSGLQVYFGVENQIYQILHFISVITIAYIFTAITLILPKRYRLAFLGVLLLAHALISWKVYGFPLFVDYLASFSIGILWGDRDQGGEFSWQNFLLALNLPFLFFSTYRFSLLISAILVIAIFSQKDMPDNSTALNKTALWLGTNSYIIYLGHNYFASKWPQLLSTVGTRSSVGGIIIIATTIWLGLLFKFSKWWKTSFHQSDRQAPILKI